MDRKRLMEFVELYLELGFALIPIAYGSKVPAVEWRSYRDEAPSRETVLRWFSRGDYNIAVICGAASGNLAGLDFDSIDAYHDFFPSYESLEKAVMVVESSPGHRHVYVRNDRPVKSRKYLDLKFEVHGDGTIMVLPPSLHPKGHRYNFVNPNVRGILNVEHLNRSVDRWLRRHQANFIDRVHLHLEVRGEKYRGRDPPCIEALLCGVEEGRRNECALRLACYFINYKWVKPQRVFRLLKDWNISNKPPLDEGELRRVVDSASNGYVYGCSGMRMFSSCNVAGCSLAGDHVKREAIRELERLGASDDVLRATRDVLADGWP